MSKTTTIVIAVLLIGLALAYWKRNWIMTRIGLNKAESMTDPMQDNTPKNNSGITYKECSTGPFNKGCKGSKIETIQKIATTGKPNARALEFVDRCALEFTSQHPIFPKEYKKAEALLYFKQEYEDEAELETFCNEWLSVLPMDNILIATTEKQKALK